MKFIGKEGENTWNLGLCLRKRKKLKMWLSVQKI